MLYETLTVKDKEYKLRLGARACVDLEKKLGTNPLNIMMSAADGSIPSLGVLLDILHASLQQYHHGISVDKVYDLYDDFTDEGNTLVDLVPIILNVFKVSGFFKDEANDLNKSKAKNS